MHVGQAVIGNMMEKSYQENIADLTELTVDGIIINKAAEGVLALSQFIGSQLVQVGSSIQQHIPAHLLDSPMTFMKTDAGDLIAVADATGENIAGAIAAQALKIAESSTPFFQFTPQAKILTDKIDELTQPNKVEVAALQKSLEPYLRTDKIVNIERLKYIEGIDQIKAFKDYTNNFTNLEKLHPDEILYLNLCDWLEPQAKLINVNVKKMGLSIIDSNNNIIKIHELDIFHSLLGEMAPGSVQKAMSGGHWFSADAKAATYLIDEIIPFNNNHFFDLKLKHINSVSSSKFKTYFPAGSTIEQCSNMVIDAIKNFNEIEFKVLSAEKQIVDLTCGSGQKIRIYVVDSVARFSPVSPFA